VELEGFQLQVVPVMVGVVVEQEDIEIHIQQKIQVPIHLLKQDKNLKKELFTQLQSVVEALEVQMEMLLLVKE
jgi:hypothetical protein